jgi:hypothetical protein
MRIKITLDVADLDAAVRMYLRAAHGYEVEETIFRATEPEEEDHRVECEAYVTTIAAPNPQR